LNIAIIGGGASGITTAYLLRNRRRVTIFEKNGYLGGHVRTLNGNVPASAIPSDLRVENGVLGFNRKTNPIFYRLMEELGIPMKSVFGSTGLYLLRERKNYIRPLAKVLCSAGGATEISRRWNRRSLWSGCRVPEGRRIDALSGVPPGRA
jgi:predicted NAD/FAD-binding protein